MATGFPVVLPRAGQNWDPYTVYVDKMVITADSAADTASYDLMINGTDADTDLQIPIFAFPAGTYVMDVGVQVLVEWTTAATITIGHSTDDNYWLASDEWLGSDLTEGVIWASRILPNLLYTSSTDQAADTTLGTVGLATLGGIVVEPSTDADVFANDSVTLDANGTNSTFAQDGRYVMTLRNDEAVAELGLMVVWVKYCLAGANRPIPSTSAALYFTPGEVD